jgi:hypothetical protein
MRSIVLAGVVAALLSTPALAEGGRLTGLPSVLLGGAAAQGSQHMLPQPPVTSISAGGASVTIGQTSLKAIASALGGTVATANAGSQSAAWLCYTATIGGTETFIWFVADGTTAEDGAINLVGANFRLPGMAEQPCIAPKSSLDSIDFSVPGLGASEADLEARFGIVAALSGFVAYSSHQGEAIQNLNYQLKDNVIVGLAVTTIAKP